MGIARARDPSPPPAAVRQRGEKCMTPIVGIFVDRASAERAVGNLRAVGISTKSIHVLVPGTSEPLVSRMLMSEAEQPGMGRAIGGVIGGAVGVASGAEIGAAAAASALLPVAGPAIAIGIVGAVLLSLSGAVVGGALENALANGLPKDELFVYEDALRRGHSIVVVMPADADEHERAVAVLEGSGAESVMRSSDSGLPGQYLSTRPRFTKFSIPSTRIAATKTSST